MANHRPKSLSELNNVYDKAMRAERAIKEGSSLLSVPETKETPQNENIFQQLETKAAQAEKNQVFDPDITNIANDFLKRYSQAEKTQTAPKEIKRPAPSIQSVYHSAIKTKQEEKPDISLNTGETPALNIDAPAVPLHKPAATIPAAKPEPAPKAVEVTPEPLADQAPEVPVVTVPQTVVTENRTATSDIPADTNVSEKPQVKTAISSPAPVRTAQRRVRITSTERNELMEEYMRVMSDDDDDETYKKPKFSFFKKKKKFEEEFDTEPMADLYEELPEEDEAAEEVSVVPFDNSNVKYTDEYSDAVSEEASAPQEQMDIYDYIEADFDYGEEEYSDDDEDGILDVSFAGDVKPQEEEAHEEYEDLAEEVTQELSEEEEEVIDDTTEEAIEEIAVTEESEEIEEVSQEEAVEAQPDEETAVCKDAPPSDMVFEDIFSVSDESMRSRTGGNWEEVFGESSETIAEETEETPADDYPEYTDNDSYEESVQPIEEYEDEQEDTEEYAEEEPAYKDSKSKLLLKILTVFGAVLCILGAAVTLMISVFLDVNSGNLISERYRAFSVSEDLAELGLEKDTLVITENIYAHIDDLYVYSDQTSAYNFGKVISNITNLSGDYLYLTKNNTDSLLVNRANSLGVVIATYTGVGGILDVICQNYILIAGALLLLAIAMIVCLILISRRGKYSKNSADEYFEDIDNSQDSDTDSSDTDSEESEDEDGEYYSDYDTDGIEQGLFNSI